MLQAVGFVAGWICDMMDDEVFEIFYGSVLCRAVMIC